MEKVKLSKSGISNTIPLFIKRFLIVITILGKQNRVKSSLLCGLSINIAKCDKNADIII